MTNRHRYLDENCSFWAACRPKNDDILILPYPLAKERPVTNTGISNEDGCGHSFKPSKLETYHGSIV